MQFRPVLFRMMFPFAVLIALIVIVCGTVVYFAGQRHVRQQQIQDLDHLADLVRHWLAGSADQIADAQRQQLLGAAEVLQTRITLIDGSGNVIFETHSSADRMENHNDRPEIVDARRGEMGIAVRPSRTVREDAVYVARLLDANQPGGIVVRLSYPKHTWPQVQLPIVAVVATAIALSIVTLLAFALMLHWRWIAPVRELASAAERLADGKWETRVSPAGADDLRVFSHKLNIVAEQAQRQLADLKAQRSDLQSLVDTLPDAIIVLDGDQRMALINTAAARLTDLAPQKVIGHPLVGAINDAAIIDLFDQLAAAARHAHPPDGARLFHKEVRLFRAGQRLIYQAVGAPTAAGGSLLVLRDVTALSATVQMKADFVANASHELRTPIAAIKIAFETLREVHQEDPAQSARCIQIIDGQLRRMEEMLRDLLDLSRVENSETKPQMTMVRPAELFQLIGSTMSPIAREKNVELTFSNADGIMEFRTDHRLLILTLKNLVENSIKFTPPGGKVTVEFSHSDGNVILDVQDTGIGIAPEHIDRVFERFYQADVSRSGGSGAGRGTGLGLAIVKHAVAALGGTVYLESELGHGTRVTCVFPRDAARHS